MRGYVSCVTDGPYTGPTPPESVAKVASGLRDIGRYEISLGDTIGHATLASTAAMLNTAFADIPADMLACHFQDTQGRAMENTAWAVAPLRWGPKAMSPLQGEAFGGGVGLAAICDVVIADKAIKLGLTETRLGLIPATISPYVVVRVGEGYARRMLISARIFEACCPYRDK